MLDLVRVHGESYKTVMPAKHSLVIDSSLEVKVYLSFKYLAKNAHPPAGTLSNVTEQLVYLT